jgi:hypothetical protein
LFDHNRRASRADYGVRSPPREPVPRRVAIFRAVFLGIRELPVICWIGNLPHIRMACQRAAGK